MNLAEIAEKASQNAVGWAVVSFLGGIVWVVRRIFTNQKQIELLQTELGAREEMRQRDRADLQEVKGDVKELRSDIRSLFQNNGENT
ncbi:hypothetical protein [Shimia sp. MIT910701]|uniref:hypothetical protein n=1 Tax=Shimia sp. MIT910701 TaxID=3096987 RepID=UPI00399BF9BD